MADRKSRGVGGSAARTKPAMGYSPGTTPPRMRDGVRRIIVEALKSVLRESAKHEKLSSEPMMFTPEELSTTECRQMLRSRVVCAGFNFSEGCLAKIERVLQHEVKGLEVPYPARLLTRWNGHANVAVWHGDITRLRIDAIVNAGNESLLGCFQPLHMCIDNVIHSRAGPRLRAECRAKMAARHGLPVKPGATIVTKGYLLPAKWVVHTVGPRYTGRLKNHELARCYTGSLRAAAKAGAKSIAFCGISTGLFGYPRLPAADTATGTVIKWLRENPGKIDLVVFCVYTHDDEQIYGGTLTRRLPATKLLTEFKAIDPSGEFTLHEAETPCVWEILFKGPAKSPYEGGTFLVTATFAPDHPKHPPKKIVFTTKVYHPNIRAAAPLDLSPMKDWDAKKTSVAAVLKFLETLMRTPNPKAHVANPAAAKQMLADPKTFEKTAKEWAIKYAS